ncbi:cysteine desulfurase family protein [Caloranaerobacter azorensis]|uniref:cysteine desulfurase family protein n=1 Tax=Caloranaerobacter azorensis TaxID=116090 RepID=UPI00326322EE
MIKRYAKRGNHIITTKIEHPSVLNIFKYYEDKGFEITYLNVNEKGIIDLKQLEDSITDKTILVSIMMVNNEIGTVQPIKEVVEIIKKKNKNVKLHVDGVQAFGKIDIQLKNLGVDAFSFSGHKIHGPKGVGGLYIKNGTVLEPIIFGGNQERGLKSGTENTPGIVGLGKAVEIIKNNFEDEKNHILEVKKYFIDKVLEKIDNIKINSYTDDRCAPHIVNISFIGVKGEVLLHYLEEDGIFVSTGSACSSHKKGRSHVLKSIGLKEEEIEGAIRFSFAFYNTKEEIEYAVDRLEKSVRDIRKIMMR